MKEEIKQHILKLFQNNNQCSFPELIMALERAGLPAQGDREMYLKENLLLWKNITPQLCDALQDLMKEGKIDLKPLSRNHAQIIYSYTILRPDLPIAEKIEPQLMPHWLPVIMQLQHHDEPGNSLPAQVTKSQGLGQQ